MKYILPFLFVFPLWAETGSETTAEIAKLNREVMVPDQLVREIERWYIADYHLRNERDERAEHEILATIRRRLLDLYVLFQPIRGEALHVSSRVNLPTGGGIIDFADLLQGGLGGFTMKMELEKQPKAGKLRVFYVSGARRRKLEDGDYGAGCDKWAELTSWFHSPEAKEPIKLYATEQRHISVAAGTWVFAHLEGDQLSLAALTFKDSRFPALQCFSSVAKSDD